MTAGAVLPPHTTDNAAISPTVLRKLDLIV